MASKLSDRIVVPVPVKDIEDSVMLGLLTLKSKMHPVVEAVQAPAVRLPKVVPLIVESTVIVQVTPPTQVAPSKIATSLAPGTEAPGAPPVVVDHIAVDVLSQVQAVVQIAKRLAASAKSGAKNTNQRRKRPNNFFISRCLYKFNTTS